MEEFKGYIESIVKNITLDPIGKREIYDEINDHLELAKQEYMNKGCCEKDAVKMAIQDFGKTEDINEKYESVYGEINKFVRWIGILLFAMYMLFLMYEEFGAINHRYGHYSSVNMIPFKSISFYMFQETPHSYTISTINLFGNVIAFIPFGFLIPIVHKRIKKFYQAVAFTASLSMLIEALQHITGRGVADIDDVILNVLGGVLGYVFFVIIFWFVRILNRAFSNMRRYI